MTEKCWRCCGTGRVRNMQTLSPADDDDCPNCYGKGETGRCPTCGEDEMHGRCLYCGYEEE